LNIKTIYSTAEPLNFNRKVEAAKSLPSFILLFLFLLTPLASWSAATGSFTQSNWVGGIPLTSGDCSTAGGLWTGSECTAVHPGDQTGWNAYSSKDADLLVVNSGADLQLGPTPDSTTQTSRTDFTLASDTSRTHTTNSDFSVGSTLSNIQVTGQGVMLDITSQSPSWTANSGWNTPDIGTYATPAFADLDGDGDLDALIGANSGVAYGYQNTGTSTAPVWTAHSAWNSPDVGSYVKPAFADLDGDGDIDLLLGESNGVSYGYENTGSSAAPVWTANSAWNTVDVGYFVAPAFADLDGDGDFDLLIGGDTGIAYGYENTGSSAAPVWTANSAWNTLDIGGNAGPAFADLDGDGDFDLLIGETLGVSFGYENTGSSAAPVWSANSAWNAPDVGNIAAPAFADLDGDTDMDLLIGYSTGRATGYENTGTTTFVLSGTFTSSVVDTGTHNGLSILNYTATTPANTTTIIDVRAGNTAVPDGSWTAWQMGVANGGDISALGTNRYVQYRGNLSTTDTAVSPTLDEMTVRYFNFPYGPDLYVTGEEKVRLRTDFVPYTIGNLAANSLANISMSGTYLFGSHDTGNSTSRMRIFDVSDPAFPVEVTSTGHGARIYDVFVSGNYAYVAATSNGLSIVDITTPGSPQVLSYYDTPGWLCRVHVQGNIAYGADWRDSGLQILDVSNPSEPVFLGSHLTPGDGCSGLYASGSHVYMADDVQGLAIFDVSDPTEPLLVHTIAGTANDVMVRGNYAYVVGSGLKIYDISTPSAPVIVANNSDVAVGSKLDLLDDFAYVIDGSVLKILDLSDISNPTQIASHETALRDVEVVNDLIYAGALSGVKVISPGPYVSPESYISSVIDVNEHLGFTTLDYTASVPVNTTLTFDVRSGSTLIPDGSWSGWVTGIANGGSIAAVPTNRYLQYRANFATSDSTVSPTLDDVTIHFNRYTHSRSLISSAYNTTDASNLIDSISWTETLPAGTDIRVQVRSASDVAGAPGVWSEWIGPDSSANSYWNSINTMNGACAGTGTITCVPAPAIRDLLNDQWMQYKAELFTAAPGSTPTFSAVTLNYGTGTSAAGFVTVSPVAGLTTTEAGGTAVFSVVLDSIPAADVTLALYSNDPGEGLISPVSLLFNNSDWNVPRTVTVTGQHDFVDDGDIAYSVITGTTISGDPNFDDINPANVSLTNIDDDTAGITVVPGASVITSEDETTDTFTVVLDSEPLSNVAIDIFSSDSSETIADPAILNFTAGNWSVAQTVTVTGIDDLAVDGNIEHTIITAAAVSSDGLYSSRNADDVTVINDDNDVADILVTPSSLTTSESSGGAAFTVRLTAQPASNVSFSLGSSDMSEGMVSLLGSYFTFTPGAWNVEQISSVSGVNDFEVDGNVAYTIDPSLFSSSDSAWNNVQPTAIPVTNIDNDGYAITVTPTLASVDLQTTEDGGWLEFIIRLSSAPTADVTIPVSTSNANEGVTDVASVTFTTNDDPIAGKKIRVAGVDDRVFDDSQAYNLIIGATITSDSNFSTDPADIALLNIDNEIQEIILEPDVSSANAAYSMATGDINNDGISDLIVGAHTDSNIGKVRVYYGSAAGYSTTPDWIAQGVNSSDEFGYSVAAADVNGDGYDDVIVGARYADNGLTNEGRVFAYYSSPTGLPDADSDEVALISDASWIADGDYNAGYFGNAVARAGDVNKDGYEDIIVGAHNFTNDQSAEGRVFAYYGSASGLPYTDCALLGDGIAHPCEANWVAESDQASSAFGATLAAAGDVNGDTYDDIMIGAYNYDNGSGNEGRVFVYYGSASGLPYTNCGALTDNIAHGCEAAWTGESDRGGANFGISMASVNVNNDAYGDIVVGAHFYNNGHYREGAAYVFHGSTTGLPDADLDGEAHPGDASWLKESNLVNGYFGSSVANAGDFNGDGYDDILVGAYYYLFGASDRPGRAFIYFGSASGASLTAGWEGSSLSGGSHNDYFGRSVLGLGDLNSDGFDEFAIGASGYDNAQISEGAAFVYLRNFEAPGFVVVPNSTISTTESGGEATFTVRLSMPPTDDVSFTLSSNDLTEGTVSPTSLTFTQTDWMTPQVVTVTGVNDALTDGNVAYIIDTNAATSADAGYDTLDPPNIDVVNVDNNVPQTITITNSGDAVEKTGSSAFTLSRNGEITADLPVYYSLSGTATAGTDYQSLSGIAIIPAGSVSTTVTVQPINDSFDELDETIVVTVTSDVAYFIAPSGNTTITIIDDDTVGISISNTTGGVTTELGGTSSFTVKLATQPAAGVDINFVSNDTTEGVISPFSLSFTTSNWGVAQTIIATGQSDSIVDGDISYTISATSVVSADADYNGVTAPIVTMTNLDDGSRATVSLTANRASVDEANGMAEYTITRTGPTDDPLRVFYSIVGSAQESIDFVTLGTSATILAGDSSVKVFIDPLQDALAEGDETIIFTLVNGSDYLVANPASATVTIVDDDSPTLARASFAIDQLVGEGETFSLSAELNRPASSYPVSIPFTLTGSATNPDDHNAVAGTLVINSGLSGSAGPFNVVADGTPEGDETIIFTMGLPTGVVRGEHVIHTVTITEVNVKPVVSLVAQQSAVDTRMVVTGDGNVTVTATVDDLNLTDTHSYYWDLSNIALINIPEASTDDPTTFVFDPTLLTPGFYAVRLKVTDDGIGELFTEVELLLEVVSTAPILSVAIDSDGDGVMDAAESFTDGDGDGIADYLDDSAIAGNALQLIAGVSGSYMMRTEAGLTLRLGETSFAANASSAQVTIDEIAAYGGGEGVPGDSSATDSVPNTGGYFDFEVAGLSHPGQSVHIVIPQLAPLPENAVYRKYFPASGRGWQDFVVNGANVLASAAGMPGECPLPGSAFYSAGLQAGHYCVQLTIEDGGPNDVDEIANYVIQDPGQFGEIAVAVEIPAQQAPVNVNGNTNGGGGTLGVGLILLVSALFLSANTVRRQKSLAPLCGLTIVFFIWPHSSQAEFILDFKPKTETGEITSAIVSMAGQACPSNAGSTGCSGHTPFLLGDAGDVAGPGEQAEFVTDPDTGISYIHIVMGDLADGFIQELYIEMTGNTATYGSFLGGAGVMLGGAFGGNQGSAGNRAGNAANPLGNDQSATGSGTANPSKVIMRQIVNDGEMSMEFLKDKFDRKPVIAQALNSPGIYATSIIDMRNSTYSDMNTPGIAMHTMVLNGPDLPDDNGQFNTLTGSQNGDVTAGRFIYTPGTGPGGADGVYEYLDSSTGFDMSNVSWESYFDAEDPSNIWAYPGAKPN